MDRLTPTLLIVLLIVVAVALMLWGWRSRRRRQSGIDRPQPVPTPLAPSVLHVDGWYVATTRADEPLERIAVHGLGFRARATAAVHPEGIVIAARGAAPFLIPRSEVRGVSRATWAIDRVVERDGLVLIAWMLGLTAVDTYLRLPERDAAPALVSAVNDIITPADPAEGIAS